MKQLTILILLSLSLVTLAMAQKVETKTPQPKVLTSEQLGKFQAAQAQREKAKLLEDLAKSEREKLDAQFVLLIREFALELHLDVDQYEIDLSLISQGVLGFKPKAKVEPELKPVKKE